MNPYSYYPGYIPQQTEYYIPYDCELYTQQQEQEEFERQQPQSLGGFERRIRNLERQNQQQAREIARLNQIVELHTFRLNRLNQRLRVVENRLNIPFASQDGF
ncbi:hypothetical protein COJ92_23890 [Priestia megaterium]|uniref:hypothetical protein n=1 Tax=Priestia megaterium TaxID=1404 RepID=UPI000BF50B66|nr:hypothetical protein [Priestia megaterium]PFP14342.1 hypothetical protein COJ92_23890 [Priestia megaterium]PFU67556.1 hypothetical protein COK90_00345 [Priestia megaterium]